MGIRSLVKSPTTCRERIQTIKDNVREYHRIYNIGLWCNGNTQDFGPWIMGSTPVSPTIMLVKKFLKIFLRNLKLFYKELYY